MHDNDFVLALTLLRFASVSSDASVKEVFVRFFTCVFVLDFDVW